MVKTKNSNEKLEEETKNSVILLTSSDDDEANEDLSLEIIEKARLREAKRRQKEDFDEFKASDGVRSAATLIDLSSSSCEEVEVVVSDRSVEGSKGVSMIGKEVEVEEKKKKKRKKKKKSKKIDEDEDKAVGVVEVEEPIETVTSVETETAGVVETEELLDIVKAEETEPVEMSDNIVLRKLLRGPRYFDPQVRSWATCYNCGEEGHNAVNCTSKKRKKPCFICGSFDHGIRHCTQGKDCFICKKRGHRAKDCPEKNQEDSQDSKICLRCGDLGHLMFSCARNYDPEDLKEIQCYVCNKLGHLCCVDTTINPGPGEVSCYNCGQSGHTGLGCAKQRGETSGAGSATLCYKCGEEGHFARGCTNNSKPNRWMAEPSTPTQKFSKKGRDSLGFRSVPPDLSKVNKKKSTEYEGRDFATLGRLKRRGGWITDDPGDIPNRKAKSNNWRSPATPTKKVHQFPPPNTGGHFLNSRSPWQTPNHYHATPSSHGSANPYQHRFTASRFGDSGGGGYRRSYDW